MPERKHYQLGSHSTAVFDWRPAGALLTAHNTKTVKGEDHGWVTAILYLAPHTLGSPKTVCPYSTPACRAACLYHAGRGVMRRTIEARDTRTLLWWDDRQAFLAKLAMEIIEVRHHAIKAGHRLAVRLNGTSDIFWERERAESAGGKTLFEMFPGVQFYDYTKAPLHLRETPDNYRLTFSLDEENLDQAVGHLRAGHSIAAVVDEEAKREHESWSAWGDEDVTWIDGDLHDLRFLDPPRSVVQLRPKGQRAVGSPMIHNDLPTRLRRAVVA